MTIHAKTNPIGIDAAILRYQNRLERIAWTNKDVYGRVYINVRENEKIAEAYVTPENEYKEIFVDDRKSAVFGFFANNTRNGAHEITSEVKLVCSCNLGEIYDSEERMDETAIMTVLNAISPLLKGEQDVEIETEMSKVFSDIDYERFKHKNMHPFFHFSIKFRINFRNKLCNN